MIRIHNEMHTNDGNNYVKSMGGEGIANWIQTTPNLLLGCVREFTCRFL